MEGAVGGGAVGGVEFVEGGTTRPGSATAMAEEDTGRAISRSEKGGTRSVQRKQAIKQGKVG